MSYTIKERVNIQKAGIAKRIMNNIIWGNSYYNPNNKKEQERRQEIINDARRQCVHND